MAKDVPLIIVSACMAGVPCRYNGKACERSQVIDLLSDGRALPICPEQLGGLATPRGPAEIVAGKVLTKDGRNVSDNYLAGAEAALRLALKSGAREAWLKSKSPMCGCNKIYDGSHTGTLVAGDGLFTALLKKAGIQVKEID